MRNAPTIPPLNHAWAGFENNIANSRIARLLDARRPDKAYFNSPFCAAFRSASLFRALSDFEESCRLVQSSGLRSHFDLQHPITKLQYPRPHSRYLMLTNLENMARLHIPTSGMRIAATSRKHSSNNVFGSIGPYFTILFLLCCSLTCSCTSHPLDFNSATSADTSQSQADYPTLTAASFGFQCGTGLPTNCPDVTWPVSVAKPGLIRLWDSQVQWNLLNPRPGTYDWRKLDRYLEQIAAHQPLAAMYTFGYGACWASNGNCERTWGSAAPPTDLTVKGSASFNTFLGALLDHCSPSGHCVKDLIKYWEMWNEANAPAFWTGTVPQLYQLMAPAIAMIRSKVPGAIVLTPPCNPWNDDWMRDWLKEENTNGRLSDVFSFHVYLQDQTPEQRFFLIQKWVDLKNSTPGWSQMPWMDTETNFHGRTFACPGKFTPDDCIGQMVRWHLLQFAMGAEHVGWYFFNTTIGRHEDYSNAYHTMMEWIAGGRFTSAKCSLNAPVISCPFVQGDGHHALFVWNFRGSSSYSPDAQYKDYKTLSGSTTAIPRGQSVTIGAQPIMLESVN